jgi:hypothetical protein
MTLLYPLKKAFRRILLSSSPFSWAGFTPHLPLFIPRPTDRHSTWFWATPVTCLLGDAEYNEGAGQDRRSATARGLVRPMAHASPYSLLDMSPPPLSLRHPPHYQAVRFSSRPSHIPLHATDSATPSYRPHPLLYPVRTSALIARAFRHTMRH